MIIPKFPLFKTLQAQFFIALILFSVVPFSLVGAYLIQQESRALEEQALRELTGLARGLSGELDTLLSELLKDSKAIASLPDIVSMDIERQAPLLRDLYVYYHTYGQLAVADLEGQLLVTGREQPLVSIAHIASFQGAAAGRQDWVIAPALFNDRLVLHMHTPIRNANGDLLGVLGSPVALPSLVGPLQQMQIGSGGQAFVLDETGAVLVHTDPEKMEQRPSYAEWIRLPGSSSPIGMNTARYETDGERRIAGYAPVPHFGWTIVVERPEVEVLAPVTASRNLAIGGLIVILVLSLVAAAFFARSLTRPVRNLAMAAQALGQGNPDTSLPTGTNSVTEIGTLIRSFQSMREAVIEREASLSRSEARNRAIVDAIPDILLRIDNEGRVLDAKGPLTSLGVEEPVQLLGESLYRYVYRMGEQSLLRQVLTCFENVLHTQNIEVVESEVSINNVQADFETRAVVSNENDEVLVIIRNITERKRAEAAVRKHLLAMSASIDGMAILEDDVYSYVNDAFAKLHGYKEPDALLGHSWQLLYTDQERRRLEQTIMPIVQQDGRWQGEAIGMRKDGTTYPQEISMARIDTGGLVSVVRDLTERNQSEKAFQQAQKLEGLGVMAGGIAHDFNNLLTGMMGQISLAQVKQSKDSDAYRHIQKALISAERAADLTRQLLAYAGKGKFQVEVINLNEFVQENVGLMETALPRRIELVLQLNPELPPIEVDKGQMQQVAMNLVINAVEAIESGQGRVFIRTYIYQAQEKRIVENRYIGGEPLEPGTYVCLEVADTGIGMDEETVNRIFDPFFSTKSYGSGLGLSATLGIIHTHRGGLQVLSKPGQGSTFRAFFPATEHSVQDIHPTATESEKFSGTVLVIDDELPVREIARDTLELMGLHVLTATNGREGFELFREYQSQVDITLLDMQMPVMTGKEVLAQIKEIEPNAKVILSSGYTASEEASTLVDQETVLFLQKPYTSEGLVEKLRELIHRHSLAQSLNGAVH